MIEDGSGSSKVQSIPMASISNGLWLVHRSSTVSFSRLIHFDEVAKEVTIAKNVNNKPIYRPSRCTPQNG
jgi:hypothetical protein